jgi:predicted nucleic acid-binding protein
VTDFVIDASVALAFCFKDELTDAISRLLNQLQNGAAAVPTLWPLEVANVLALAERRRESPLRKAHD